MDWISVSERMPDEGQEVVIADTGHGCIYAGAVATYIAPHFYLMEGLEASNYDGGAIITIDFEATHWLPLPKPASSK